MPIDAVAEAAMDEFNLVTANCGFGCFEPKAHPATWRSPPTATRISCVL